MFRVLHRLALVIVSVVCAGMMSPGRGGANLAVPAEAAAAFSHAARGAFGAEASHQLSDGPASPVVSLKAIESDIDERDKLRHVADDPAVAFSGVSFPRTPGRAPRSERQIEPSRFVISTGSPRGPPV